VLCAQVGITKDINHEVFRSLLESQESCALHLQVALSGHVVYNLLDKTLVGGFPDEKICIFFETFGSPLEPLFLGASDEAFLRQLPFARPHVQPLWLNEGMEVLPQ
jgi:hypothetical protein